MARDEIIPVIIFQNNYSCKDGNLLAFLHYNCTVGSMNSALFDLANSDCYPYPLFRGFNISITNSNLPYIFKEALIYEQLNVYPVELLLTTWLLYVRKPLLALIMMMERKFCKPRN